MAAQRDLAKHRNYGLLREYKATLVTRERSSSPPWGRIGRVRLATDVVESPPTELEEEQTRRSATFPTGADASAGPPPR